MDNYKLEYDNVLKELKKYFHFYNLNIEYEVVIKTTRKFGVLDIVEF